MCVHSEKKVHAINRKGHVFRLAKAQFGAPPAEASRIPVRAAMDVSSKSIRCPWSASCFSSEAFGRLTLGTTSLSRNGNVISPTGDSNPLFQPVLRTYIFIYFDLYLCSLYKFRLFWVTGRIKLFGRSFLQFY